MKKIEEKLAKLINDEPGKEFKVIMVTESNTDFNKLELRQFNRLMDNILSATLTGKEIINLSKNNKIISIEPDMEMNIL